MAFYVVTGGAGFIGSHLAEELERRGERVRVVDNLSTGHRATWRTCEDVEFVEGRPGRPRVGAPRRRGRRLRAAPGGHSVGAAVGQRPDHVEPIEHRRHAERAGGRARRRRPRVVYAGSSSAYGDTPTLPKREDMPTNPLSPYALQKLVGEQYLQIFTRLYGLETVTIRYFNVFGPRQDPSSPYSGVISLFASALLDGRPDASAATASRRATSPTWPTSSTACCGRAPPRRAAR
jgi:nucleoside-diphosphate-sugar epimerase